MNYPMYDELDRVLAAQGQYQFVFKKLPQRDITINSACQHRDSMHLIHTVSIVSIYSGFKILLCFKKYINKTNLVSKPYLLRFLMCYEEIVWGIIRMLSCLLTDLKS